MKSSFLYLLFAKSNKKNHKNLSMSLNSLPQVLLQQIGHYFRKALPAYCEVQLFPDVVSTIPLPDNSPHNMTESTIIKYYIKRHGEVKFYVEFHGTALPNVYIFGYQEFKRDKNKAHILKVASTDCIFFTLKMGGKEAKSMQISAGAASATVFKSCYYKKAFEDLLEDLFTRITYMASLDKNNQEELARNLEMENGMPGYWK